MRSASIIPVFGRFYTFPMIKRLAAGIFIACTLGPVHAQKPVDPQAAADIVKRRLAESEIPACIAVAIVGETSATSFACSAESGPVELKEDSLFEIGSITKGLTGLLLADMVRKGEVKLDDPASLHARPGARLPTRGGRHITLRDLVTHTAGLPRLPPGFRPADWRNPYASFTEDDLYAALARTQLASDIGATSAYSNFGFMWLSEMLARRAGKPFAQLLAERVLEPLGMRDTRIVLDAEDEKRRVQGHDVAYDAASPWDLPASMAGVGGVRASIRDMRRLAEALAGRRSTPLDETIELALTPLHRRGESQVGYGWLLREQDGAVRAMHGGGTGGFSSVIAFDRRAKVAVVLLADSVARFDDLAEHLIDPRSPLRPPPPAVALEPGIALADYEGRYALASDFIVTVYARRGRLYSQATGQGPVVMRAWDKDRFVVVGVAAEVVFARNSEGRVTSLTLKQGGRDTRGRRVE